MMRDELCPLFGGDSHGDAVCGVIDSEMRRTNASGLSAFDWALAINVINAAANAANAYVALEEHRLVK